MARMQELIIEVKGLQILRGKIATKKGGFESLKFKVKVPHPHSISAIKGRQAFLGTSVNSCVSVNLGDSQRAFPKCAGGEEFRTLKNSCAKQNWELAQSQFEAIRSMAGKFGRVSGFFILPLHLICLVDKNKNLCWMYKLSYDASDLKFLSKGKDDDFRHFMNYLRQNNTDAIQIDEHEDVGYRDLTEDSAMMVVRVRDTEDAENLSNKQTVNKIGKILKKKKKKKGKKKLIKEILSSNKEDSSKEEKKKSLLKDRKRKLLLEKRKKDLLLQKKKKKKTIKS